MLYVCKVIELTMSKKGYLCYSSLSKVRLTKIEGANKIGIETIVTK